MARLSVPGYSVSISKLDEKTTCCRFTFAELGVVASSWTTGGDGTGVCVLVSLL